MEDVVTLLLRRQQNYSMHVHLSEEEKDVICMLFNFKTIVLISTLH